MSKTPLIDARIQIAIPFPTPDHFRQSVPVSASAQEKILAARDAMSAVVHGDQKLAVIVGPCSIHSEQGAYQFADLLATNQHQWPHLLLFMRCCFEKPRTILEGPQHWRGLASDPIGDGSNQIQEGIMLCRKIGTGILERGIQLAAEALDPYGFNYLADMFAVAWLGARSSGCQTHWQMVSGCSMPVGVKHGTNGDGTANLPNILRSISSHLSFTAQLSDGQPGLHVTTGNPDGFAILRGVKGGPNFGHFHTLGLHQLLSGRKLNAQVCVDLSHGNATEPNGDKNHKLQLVAGADVAQQIRNGAHYIGMVMIESSVEEGKQPHPARIADADPYKSITDPCLNWSDTCTLLDSLEAATATRF